MATKANAQWNPDSGARWDAALQVGDSALARERAQANAKRLRVNIDAYENGIASLKPSTRATLRERYSPWYYDLHRAESLASAPSSRYHIRTRELASGIATKQPGSLADALDEFGDLDGITHDDVAREYMLWRHSLHPTSLDEIGATTPTGLFSSRKNIGDALNIDETLRDVFGNMTRGPQTANLAFADVHNRALVRGTTTPEGHMIVGVMPGTGEATMGDNRTTGIEQMSHSLLARHHAAEQAAFKTHFGADEPSESMAMAMTHGVFAHPGFDPQSAHAPSDYAVHYTSRAFGRNPTHDPGLFRSHE